MVSWGHVPPDCSRGRWGRPGSRGQSLVRQKRRGGQAPGGRSARERTVSTQGSPGLLQPGLPQPVCALGSGVFPALGSGSSGREGSTGLSA